MDFEVKHLICAGLDVHKKTIVAAVCMTDPVTLEAAYKVKSFSTNNSQIAAMRDWLLSYNCHDVCMESTGKYWIPVFNILETHMHVVLTHPKYVKAIKGKKRINVTQNGLRIFSVLILLRHLLFHRLISGHSVSFPDTVSSFPICVPLKKTASRTV